MSKCGLFLLVLCGLPAFAQFAPNRYALFLADPPVGARFTTRNSLRTGAAQSYKMAVERAQAAVKTELALRNIRVTGSVSTLLDAIFVVAPPQRVAELKALPGVTAVVPMRRGHKFLNKATELLDGPAAWARLGGQGNAGQGIKIGILDTGIDLNHPAFQDSSLPSAGGNFPICNSDPTWSCSDFTNHKVIVARSYVRQIAAGSTTEPPSPATSQPDDYSPRDRDGHGTAVASAAAASPTSNGTVPITGMAPKAYLGNYKIYGSPGVNDFPPEDVWVQAIDDAINDGMDIVSFSSGFPALAGPLDTGASCGISPGVPCDPLAFAFESAVQHGMVVVVAAGNSGFTPDAFNSFPVFGSIGSPANAPSVISVGATINSHVFGPSVSVAGPGAPPNLQNIAAVASDSFVSAFSVAPALQAPLVDASFVGDPFACSPLPAGSLDGVYALVEREGDPASPNACLLSAKAANVQAAGAIGMVLYNAPDNFPWPAGFVEGVDQFSGPVVGLANADGVNLKNFIDAAAFANYAANQAENPWPPVIIDLAGVELPSQATPNTLASYSSLGPALGSFPLCPNCGIALLKPDLVATGGGDSGLSPDPSDQFLFGFPGLYLATQSFDSSGALFSVNGYVASDGTSFAAPLVAGAAALVKQAHPAYTVAQVRSALVNQADLSAVPTDDFGNPVDVRGTGAGLLNAATAVQASVVASPATLSFGAVGTSGPLPGAQTITITNLGPSAVTLAVAAVWQTRPTSGDITFDRQSLSLEAAGAPGATATFTATLAGGIPTAGSYSGNINLTGTGVSLHIPFLFLVGSNALGSGGSTVTGNVIPLFGTSFDGIAGQDLGALAIQLVDASGVAISGAPVTFSGGGSRVTFASVEGEPACSPSTSSVSVTCNTDSFGIAYADVRLGPIPATVTINATAANIPATSIPLSVTIRQQPTTAGVAEAAQGKTSIAPGSYVSLYGSALSDSTDTAVTQRLPLSLNAVTVSFDAPSAGISVPGRILYVSPTQVNVQAPWELQALASGTPVQMKVTINEFEYGNVVTVPVAPVVPAFFETSPGAVAAIFSGTFTFVNTANPISPGQKIQLFVNGLGPVENQPASGDPAGSSSSTTVNLPVVTIGGQPATVSFSGLYPGTPGLYEVEVTAPNVGSGNQPIALTIAGQTATSSIPVK